MREEWFLWPAQAHQIATRYAELATRGFNLYAGICLFARRKRSYASALPSPWLWLDDAPADVVCTELVRSSEASRQAWVELDQALSAEARKRLQVAWRDARGADACSADAVHMARVPGGFNTKRHARYLVHVERASDRQFSAQQLLSNAPARSDGAGAGAVTDLGWPGVERHLSNIGALLASARAACIKPDTQSGRILRGEMLAFSVGERQDDSRSMNGYVLGNGFYLRGFPDDEIAAVMLHHYRKWGLEHDKGTAWCKADIGRALARMHAAKPGIVQAPTRYHASAPVSPLVDAPAASRARADRPRTLDPLMLFHRYTADPALCALSRKPRAVALGISTATLDRLDLALRGEGLITIEQPGPGLPGRVLILGGVINIGADGVLSAAAAPIEDLGAAIGETGDRIPQCIEEETHQPPEAADTPPAAAPMPRTLAEAVRLAFDRVFVDQATGERRRATRKRLLLALEALWPHALPAPQLDQAIAAERTRRRCAAIIAGIASMSPATLRGQLRFMERLSEKSREQGTNLHRFADWAARELRREMASRPAEPGRAPRKNCEALPDLHAAAERQQAELWEVAERGLAQLRAERAGRRLATPLGLCPPSRRAVPR
ncbi:MAG TPA: DNA-primase RepB domain-containing protein [Kouleothrix sp.]|nr:DNA-primase RepB domain-containing protein [Kouleothrix sp.]HRC74322.1 DNA-primase RepB domain-containing protein [Kouleothrix sp.]